MATKSFPVTFEVLIHDPPIDAAFVHAQAATGGNMVGGTDNLFLSSVIHQPDGSVITEFESVSSTGDAMAAIDRFAVWIGLARDLISKGGLPETLQCVLGKALDAFSNATAPIANTN